MTRIRKLALLGAATAALGITGASAGTGVASATAVHPAYFSCTSANGSGICTDILFSTTLWRPNNTSAGTLRQGDEVEVTCWYRGNTADGFWDHVVWDSRFGLVIGHVDDDAVGFNGHTPDQVPGLHQC
jgi:hypothetical protein